MPLNLHVALISVLVISVLPLSLLDLFMQIRQLELADLSTRMVRPVFPFPRKELNLGFWACFRQQEKVELGDL